MDNKIIQKNGKVFGDAIVANEVFNNCTFNTSTDKCIELLQNGEFEEAQTFLSGTFNTISSQHPLYPKYGYNVQYSNGKSVFGSEPLSMEAIKEFPPKIVGKCMVRVGNMNSNDVDDIEEYSYRNQEPIIIKILDAKKLLGDVIDPLQWEVEQFIGKEQLIPPRPFPPSVPCVLLVNDIIIYDYILLRTERIINDTTIAFSNIEQVDSDIKISLAVDLLNTSTDFKVNINPSNNKSLLKYVEFMNLFDSNSKLTIQVLPSHGVFFEGNIKSINYTSAFENIKDEIIFLRNIIYLEVKFKKVINIPTEIYQDDMDTIQYLVNTLNGKGYSGEWTDVNFEMKLTPENRITLLRKEDIPLIISFLAEITVSLFNDNFTIKKIRRTFKKAYYKNLDKVVKLAEILDDGDIIKIEFVPEPEGGIGEMIDIAEL